MDQQNSTSKPSGDETVKVYMRIRPTTKNAQHINIIDDDSLELSIIKQNQGYINNSKEKHRFKFEHIYDMNSKQEDIFEGVAKEVVDSVLEGFNGTIFAYGQTGSGKTYTITGGLEKSNQKGIIPRTINYIFRETANKPNYNWTIRISYLEIYNNQGYDLLYSKDGESNLRLTNIEDLPRVEIRENRFKQFVFTNLNSLQVHNEREALVLLMTGDDNRVIAETPKNDSSTRSHCIFIIQIESQKSDEEDKRTVSKLHIVDLSGSEKPFKTELNGIRMDEALNINLSLHFLEQVIISLNRRDKHIPYRNSMMTMALRDALGGNCKTRMIATMNGDPIDIMESMSTCRFAQRVALIKNNAVINEIDDPSVVIQQQKKEINELKNELALVKGYEQKTFLEQEDIEDCKRIVHDYLIVDREFQTKINLKDMLLIQECFSIIKVMYYELEKKVNDSGKTNQFFSPGNVNLEKKSEIDILNKKLTGEINSLKDIIKSREEEIKVLLSKIDKYQIMEDNFKKVFKKELDPNKRLVDRLEDEDKLINDIRNNAYGNVVEFERVKFNKNENLLNAFENKAKDDSRNSSFYGGTNSKSTNINTNTMSLNTNNLMNSLNTNSIGNNNQINNFFNNSSKNPSTISNINNGNSSTNVTQNYNPIPISLLKEINTANTYLNKPLDINKEIAMNNLKMYEIFRNNYIKFSVVEEENKKKALKEMFDSGQILAKDFVKLKDKSSSIKTNIENIRREKIVNNIDDERDPNNIFRRQEDELIEKFNDVKIESGNKYKSMKNIEEEIKSLKADLDALTKKRTKDFEFWKEIMLKKLNHEEKYGSLNLNNINN